MRSRNGRDRTSSGSRSGSASAITAWWARPVSSRIWRSLRSRSRRHAPTAARSMCRAPWLPPNTRTVRRSGSRSSSPWASLARRSRSGGTAATSSRMGFPVSSTRLRPRKRRCASGNDTAVAAARRDRNRLARPGTAFCSCRTTGRPALNAAITAGPLAYPPIPTTTSTSSTRGRHRLTDRSITKGNRNRPADRRRTRGAASTSTNGNPAAGTSWASSPNDVPANRTSAPWSATRRLPTASAGYTCPAVPPPAMRTFIGGSFSRPGAAGPGRCSPGSRSPPA